MLWDFQTFLRGWGLGCSLFHRCTNLFSACLPSIRCTPLNHTWEETLDASPSFQRPLWLLIFSSLQPLWLENHCRGESRAAPLCSPSELQNERRDAPTLPIKLCLSPTSPETTHAVHSLQSQGNQLSRWIIPRLLRHLVALLRSAGTQDLFL